MRHAALVVDSEVFAGHGTRVAVSTNLARALSDVRRGGRRVVLVTRADLDEAMVHVGFLEHFDAIVAEAGALLYLASPEPVERPLAAAAPFALIEALRDAGVRELSCGRLSITVDRVHAPLAQRVARAFGFDVLPTREALVLVPMGVDEGAGVRAAFDALAVDPARTVGVGRGLGALRFLPLCGLGVAVSDAASTVLELAELVTAAPHARGFTELCGHLDAVDEWSAPPPVSVCREVRLVAE